MSNSEFETFTRPDISFRAITETTITISDSYYIDGVKVMHNTNNDQSKIVEQGKDQVPEELANSEAIELLIEDHRNELSKLNNPRDPSLPAKFAVAILAPPIAGIGLSIGGLEGATVGGGLWIGASTAYTLLGRKIRRNIVRDNLPEISGRQSAIDALSKLLAYRRYESSLQAKE